MASKGWFDFKDVPVEKFVSPIIFDETSLVLSGQAHIKGTFDSHGLSLTYDKHSLKLDHSTFTVNLESSENAPGGHHYFDFTQNTHFGDLGLDDARLLVKGQNMTFDHIKGLVEVTPEYIRAQDLHSQILDLNLNTSFKLGYSAIGDLDMRLDLKEFYGDFKDFKSVFSRIGYSAFEKLPFSGKVKTDPKGAYMQLVRKGEDVDVHMALIGNLNCGTLPFISDQPLTDVSFSFAFDSATELLEVKDFEGVWKSHRKQQYQLYSHYLKVNLFNDDPCHFDVKIKDSYKDRARLIGKLYLNVAQKGPALKIVLDQKNNHIGSLGLTNVYFALDENFNLDYLNVNFSGNLTSVQQDVTLLQNMFPKISSTSLMGFKWLSLDGDLSGQWVYDVNQGRHQFFIWGDRVEIGSLSPNFFQLKGYHQAGSTVVEDLTYHTLKGSFKVDEKPFCYMIKDLSMHSEPNFDLKLSGIYCKIFNSFQLDIEKLATHAAYLKEMIPMGDQSPLRNSDGKIEMNGRLEGGYFKGDLQYQLRFKGISSNLKIADLLFKDGDIEGEIEGNFNQLQVKHLKGGTSKAFDEPLEISFEAKDFLLKKNQPPKLKDLSFSMPVDQLPSIEKIVKKNWQVEVPSYALEIKKTGLLEGSLCYEPEAPNYSLRFSLKDGLYSLMGHDHVLDQFEVDFGSLGFKLGLYDAL